MVCHIGHFQLSAPFTPRNKTGAVIVSTPQDVALADVRRGISMFRKISVPVCLLQYTLSCAEQDHMSN